MPKEDVEKIGKKYTDQLGLGKNFFHNLRRNNKECYDYIMAKVPGDTVASYRAFIKEKEDVAATACKIYHELEDTYLIHKFGRFLVHKGLYAESKSYFYTYRVIFNLNGIKTFDAFIRTKKSNKYYEEFKELK